MPNGTVAQEGFTALAQHDSNNDGLIDISDAVFDELRVWIDADADGYSGSMELFSLDELGIKSLSLDAQETSIDINGNTLGLISHFEREDGTTGVIGDVWLQTVSSITEGTETAPIDILQPLPDPLKDNTVL